MALCRNIAVGIYTIKATKVTNDQHYHNTTESTVTVL